MVRRKNIVAGNWKMNLQLEEAVELFSQLNDTDALDVQTIIFPPVVFLPTLNALKNKKLALGVQNFYPAEKGAFTGEISVSQAFHCGARFALIGHSERRTLFNEPNSFLKEKVNSAISNHITPVFCCGEPLEIREKKEEKEYVKTQLLESLFHLSSEDLEKSIIAYEPIWAIGTGLTATVEQAEEMHAFIRKCIEDHYSKETAQKISILYGGSCNASNASELFACANVDGGLIGGASLDAQSFEQIIHSF